MNQSFNCVINSLKLLNRTPSYCNWYILDKLTNINYHDDDDDDDDIFYDINTLNTIK